MTTRQDVPAAPPVLGPLEVGCHYCGAHPAQPCRDRNAFRTATDGPHISRLRASRAAHDGWEASLGTRVPPNAWQGLGTATQAVLRMVAACVTQGTAASYRPDTRSNPIYEWGAIRDGYYTWTPTTGAQFTPLGRALLADANTPA